MSLALTSKVKPLALASKPLVLENCPVLGTRTAVFFELLKFRRSPEKFFEDLFLLENTCACVLGPWLWPREFLSLASRGSVLGRAVLGLCLGFFFVSLALASSIVSSTPTLILSNAFFGYDLLFVVIFTSYIFSAAE